MSTAWRWLSTTQPRNASLVVFGVLFALYAVTAAYSVHQTNDTLSALLPAWQFATHGNLTLSHTIVQFDNHSPWYVPSGDRIVSNRMPGVIFFGVPFYWLLGRSSYPTYYPGAIASAFAAAMAMTLLFLLFRKLASQRTALIGTAIAAVGTCTWSISADSLWTHGPNQLWLLLGLLLVAGGHRWSSGLAFGAAVLTRPHTALIAAATGLGEAVRRRSLWPAVQVGAGAVLGGIAFVAYERHLFGAATSVPGYSTGANSISGTSNLWLNVAGTLVSPERGILVISPFFLLLIPGLRAAWRVAPGWVRSAAVGGLLYMATQLWHNGFTGGDGFFGYRVPLEMLTVAAPLLLLCYTEWTALGVWRSRLFMAAALYSVAAQLYGSAFFPARPRLADPWTTFMVGWSVHSVTFMVLLGAACLAGAAYWLLRHRRRATEPVIDAPALSLARP